MNTDHQDALIAWQGGDLPQERLNALLERLRVDADFRRTLAGEVWTLSLAKVAQSPDPRWLVLQEEIGWIDKPVTGLSGEFEASLMQDVRREPLRFVNAWWRRAATVAAAAVVVLSATLLFEKTHDDAPPRETLAVLVSSDSAYGSRAVGAGPLRMEEGHARLLFTNGVIVDVEGPADLQLLSVSRVICREGMLHTQVPKGAEGFCVETQRGAVTDLGTELGILVSRGGKTDVAVFEGQAELSVEIPGQQGMRTALLSVKERAAFESGSGEIHMGSDAAFLTTVQLPAPPLHLPAHYAQQILSAKPTHYWRLNRSANDTAPNEIAGGPGLRMVGGVDIEDGYQGHSSARFRGGEKPGVLVLERPWRTPSDGYAMEFWFNAETLEQMAIAALTTTDATRPHLGLVEIGGRRPGESTGAGILRYLLRWPQGHRDGMNLYSPSASALPYQWHHVVAQQNAGNMELFLDGKLVGRAVADDAPLSVDALLQIGSLEYRPGQDSAHLRRPFAGRIAEVAVYERLLTQNEVESHAEKGAP